MSQGDLVALAHEHRVATEVVVGGVERAVSPDTLRTVLGALGVSAGTHEDTVTSLDLMRGRWNPLPSVVTTVEGRRVRVEALLPAGRLVQARVEAGDGSIHGLRVEALGEEVRLGRDQVRKVSITVDGDLPAGRHLLTVDFGDGAAACPLLVGPTHLPPPELLAGRQGWGVVGDLGAVGSALTEGRVPDLGDLAEVVSWVGDELRGDFVTVPEQVTVPAPFIDPARIRVRDVPEAAWVEGSARSLLASRHADALRAVYAVPRSPRRERALARFCEQAGQPLVDLATYLTLAKQYGPDSGTWPSGLRSATDLGVDQAREARAEEVQFHRWCQWVADEQLDVVGRSALGAGMGVGVVQTVVLGGSGGDAAPASQWMLGDWAAAGVTLGRAPAAEDDPGEVGSRPPWNPQVVRDLGYAPASDLLRHTFRHRQGILLPQLDQLFRQWWVPAGGSAADGTWVGMDHEAMATVVGIAARAAGGVVIGGTSGVEPWAQHWLIAQGILPQVDLVTRQGLRHPDELPITALTTLGVSSSELPDELRLMLVQRQLVPAGASLIEQARAAQRLLGWMPPLLRGVDVADLGGGAAPSVESLSSSAWARRLARQLSQR